MASLAASSDRGLASFGAAQEIGLLIEDPFHSILKLDKICSQIQKDVQQTLEFGQTVPGSTAAGGAGGERERVRYGRSGSSFIDVSQAASEIRADVTRKGKRARRRRGAASDGNGAVDEALAEPGVDRGSCVAPLDTIALEDGDVIEASVTASRMPC